MANRCSHSGASKPGISVIPRRRPRPGPQSVPAPVKPVPWLKRANELVSDVFSLTTRLVIAITIVVIVWWLVLEHTRDVFVIEKPRVSAQLDEAGYDSNLVMNTLISNLSQIALDARSKSDFREYVSTYSKPEIKAEFGGVGVSAEQIASAVSKILGKEPRFIRCHILKTSAAHCLYLEIRGRPLMRFKCANTDADVAIDSLLRQAALSILAVTDPTTLAYYHFRERRMEKAKSAARHVLEQNHRDSKWAYNLLGKIYNDQKHYDSAAVFLRQAVGLDSTFVSAYNNLGISYFNGTASNRDSLALFAFKRCIAFDHDGQYKYARYMLGKVYTRLQEYNTATRYYKMAIEIDSSYALAYNNLAFTYNLMAGDNLAYADSALVAVDNGLAVPVVSVSDRRVLLTTLAETKLIQGDTTAFFDNLRRATMEGFRFSQAVLQTMPYKAFLQDPRFIEIAGSPARTR